MDSNTYVQVHPDETFRRLAEFFGTTVINGEIRIPANVGIGSLKEFRASSGLAVINWDIRVQQPLCIERKEESPAKKVFHLFYAFTADQITLTDKNNNNPEEKTELKHIVFSSADNMPELFIKPFRQSRMIEIEISDNWLSEEYANNNRVPYPFYAILMKQKQPIMFTEPVSCLAYNLLSDLYNTIDAEKPDVPFVRSRVLSLLSDIFDGVSKRNMPGYKNNIAMQDKMITVEQILEEHLDKTLPSIKAISQQVTLSESTLIRNFKAIYGTSIYEYYLRQKMKKAIRLFEENPRTVKEVAYMLGYEKVSNFIEIFKKHYHYPPGQLKKIQGG
jgi:AraC-like DNA-binding protein